MTCPKTEFWLADHVAGRLAEDAAEQLAEHLRSCPECRAEASRYQELWDDLGEWPDEEPRPQVRERFESMLAARRTARWPRRERTARPRWRQLASWAAIVALTVGGFAAGRGWRDEPPADIEMQALRDEVATLTRLVSLNLLARDSASHRLRGVAFAQRAQPDSALVDVLIDVVRDDESTNVRLAAIETLGSLDSGTAPLPEIGELLTPEQPPMVQIALVELLLTEDRGAVQRFRTRPGLDRDVAAHIDLLLASSDSPPESTSL